MISGDLADKVLYDTMIDSMKLVSVSEEEEAQIYRTLNKDKNLFSETRTVSSFDR